MRSRKKLSPVSIGLARAIVLILLAYTAIDLFNPQYCAKEFLPAPTKALVAASHTTPGSEVPSFTKANDRKEAPVPSSPHEGEDCFCCCTHVLPAIPTHGDTVTDIKSSKATVIALLNVSADLKAPYHPPRFS